MPLASNSVPLALPLALSCSLQVICMRRQPLFVSKSNMERSGMRKGLFFVICGSLSLFVVLSFLKADHVSFERGKATRNLLVIKALRASTFAQVGSLALPLFLVLSVFPSFLSRPLPPAFPCLKVHHFLLKRVDSGLSLVHRRESDLLYDT